MTHLDDHLLLSETKKGLLAIAGNQPSPIFVKNIIERYRPKVICAADSGAEMLIDAHILPDILIGDFDSIDPKTEDYYRRQKVTLEALPKEKNVTDTEYALEVLLKKDIDEIIILGAFGGRIDHELAVLTRISQHHLEHPGIRLVALSPEIALCAIQTGQYTICNKRKYLSVIAMDPQGMMLSYKGLKYPLHNFKLPFGSARAVSNELEEEQACINVHSGFGLLMLTQDAKRRTL